MMVTDTASHKVSSWNRQTYQRLQLALTLGLRRQLFVAVCDDLSLRNRLAGKLHNELGATGSKTPMDAQSHPQLVSLTLNLREPNPLAQIAQWLAQHQQSQSSASIPAFQILGVERLTRQPPAAQRIFLRRLQTLERNLSRLDSTLLLWLPRPWFYTIQQSVPEFWQWHTGIFEFEGEPTPLPPVGASKPEASPASVPLDAATDSFQADLRTLLTQDLIKLGEMDGESSNTSSPPQQQSAATGTPTAKTGAPSSPGANHQQTLADFRVGDANQKSEADQIDELISHYEAQLLNHQSSQAPQEAQQSQQPPTSQPASPADDYLNLGNYYRHIIEQGDASEENLSVAIQAYEQALQLLEPTCPQAADILNDVGNLYWMLSRCPGSTEHKLSYLEKGIQAYQLALTKLTAEESPHTYAMIQNNLGAAYGDLARHKDSAESLEQSIRAYQEALRYRRAENEPTKYASTQNNLGTAYWNLAQHQSPVPNLRAAIASYAEALSFYDTKSEPMSWAMIQNNLGTAYWNLAQYEQPDNWLELAIVAYQDALTYRTAEIAPAACAATENNLGTAYWHLADRVPDDAERRADYLHKCIVAYEKAITLVQQLAQNTPQSPVNFDVLATHNNLGLAHYQLATEPLFSLSKSSKSTHLEAALNQHLQACNGVNSQTDSYQITLSYIIKTIRAFYQECGIAGQNLALSKVPGQMLPEILPRL